MFLIDTLRYIRGDYHIYDGSPVSRELYADATILAVVALLYVGIIILLRRFKKDISRIIAQDVMELEEGYFVEYLNAERERRKNGKGGNIQS